LEDVQGLVWGEGVHVQVGGFYARREQSFKIAWHKSLYGAERDKFRDDLVDRKVSGSVVFGGRVPGSWKVNSESVPEMGSSLGWFGVPVDWGIVGKSGRCRVNERVCSDDS